MYFVKIPENIYMHKLLLAIGFITLQFTTKSQVLKPGFDKYEFIELLKIGARTSTDSSYYNKLPAPAQSTLIYQSQLVGFDNLWQLWKMNNGIPVISIRGTTKTPLSFLANVYAAMVPANGSLQLEKDFTFDYHLSDDPKAAVHIGFLMAAAYLSRDIIPKIDSCYKTGSREFIITGHSQGGAITYTLTSYLEQLKHDGKLPKDIRFKTCAAAAPKPGNLYYAYEFEKLTEGGWAYNAVNTVDWVPEVPVSIQTSKDFSVTNPFVNIKKVLRKQKFPVNIVLLHAYNRMDKPSRRAQRNYTRWLGKRISLFVKKNKKDFVKPAYYASMNYVRTGYTVLLKPDAAYFEKFPENTDSIWHNHTQIPYLFIMERMVANDHEKTQMQPSPLLNGSWELDYIAAQAISFDSLYKEKKPMLIFNTDKNELSGNSSCNSFSGKIKITANTIDFGGPLAMTMMACPGNGEKIFLDALQSANRYSVNESGLTLIKDDMAIMHFKLNKAN